MSKFKNDLITTFNTIKHIMIYILHAKQNYLYQGAILEASKWEAPSNIYDLSVTRLTFQFDNDWLNEEALSNIHDMFVTWHTFQSDNDWLNPKAP